MLTGLAWLALEVERLEPARAFYGDVLELSDRDADDRRRGDGVSESHRDPGDATGPTASASEGGDGTAEATFAAGETDLVLRRPTAVPRGGLHTHFAFEIPSSEYDDWWDRLESRVAGELEEVTFGSAKSLYCFDPDGNCVELGQRSVDGPGIDGIFEVVLEVEALERAERFYGALGFETVDRGDERPRVRMDGPMALELWEPQLGIAGARGGVHVDLGFETGDLDSVADAAADGARRLDRSSDGSRLVVRDRDGHHLTILERSSEH